MLPHNSMESLVEITEHSQKNPAPAGSPADSRKGQAVVAAKNPVLKALESDAAESGAVTTPSLPEGRTLASLSVNPRDDESELLKSRFLCRGGGLLLVGPTGVGKSSFVLQGALTWSMGQPLFGIAPRGPLRILLMQAENDDGDLVEMRDGVLSGMTDSGILSPGEARQSARNVIVVRDVVSTGESVGQTLDALLVQHPSDLVILDPAFSYLGGDASSAADVSHFLRQVINPVLLKQNVGIIVVHHTNKPPRGNEKAEWKAGDFAYLGTGSAEWANWARSVVAIRSIGSESIFELRAPKRGARIGWKDKDDEKTTTKYITHSLRGICWHEVPADKVKELLRQVDGSKPHHLNYLSSAVELAKQRVWTMGEYKSQLINLTGNTSDRAVKTLVQAVFEDEGIGQGRYNRGVHPVYLIGPRAAVAREIEQKTMPDGEGAG